MEHREKIEELFNRYLSDQCSQEEVQILLKYFNADENEALLKSMIQQELVGFPNSEVEANADTKAKLHEIYKMIKKRIDESGEGS